MKRAVIGAALLALAITGSGCTEESKKSPESKKQAESQGATESKKQGEVPTTALEQRKMQLLKGLDQQIKRLQQEKDCLKAAKSDEELNGCRKKPGISSGKKTGPSQAARVRPGATGGVVAYPVPGGEPEPDDETPE